MDFSTRDFGADFSFIRSSCLKSLISSLNGRLFIDGRLIYLVYLGRAFVGFVKSLIYRGIFWKL